jgi:cell division protein ZapA
MKQIQVQIMQQSYLLSCPEGRELHLLEAVERIDTAMTRIRDAGKVRSRERIAVLAALNMAFEAADRETRALTALAEVKAAQEQAAQEQAAAAAEALLNPPQDTPETTDSVEINSDEFQRLQQLLRQLDSALDQPGA